MVTRHRARVRGRRPRARRRRADLQHRHAHALVRAHGQRLAQPRAVAVGLDQQRDRPHALLAREHLDPVRRRDHGLVPGRDRGVQPQPAPRRQRVHDQVAALRDERDVPRLRRGERVAPQRRARVQRDQPVAVRPADGQRVAPRGLAELELQRPRRPPSRRTRRRRRPRRHSPAHRPPRSPPARRPPGSRPRPRRARPGDRSATGKQGTAVDRRPARVDAPHVAGEAEALQVQEGLGRVGVGPLGRADDRHRSGVEQAVH